MCAATRATIFDFYNEEAAWIGSRLEVDRKRLALLKTLACVTWF